jgi:hypothetical protein
VLLADADVVEARRKRSANSERPVPDGMPAVSACTRRSRSASASSESPKTLVNGGPTGARGPGARACRRPARSCGAAAAASPLAACTRSGCDRAFGCPFPFCVSAWQQHDAVELAHALEVLDDVVHVVAVDRADVGHAELLEHVPLHDRVAQHLADLVDRMLDLAPISGSTAGARGSPAARAGRRAPSGCA